MGPPSLSSPHHYVSAHSPNSQQPASASICLRASLAAKACSAHLFSWLEMPGNYHHPGAASAND